MPIEEQLMAVIDRMIDLEQALRRFVDHEPCRLDHRGKCRTHGLTKPCRNAWARVLLGMDEP
jgi:hypothetical protein